MDGFAEQVRKGIPGEIPPMPPPIPGAGHAPARPGILNQAERELALANALRYFPSRWHSELAPEFAEELRRDGRIIMRRFRPAYPMHARPIGEYPCRTPHAAAIMLMIQNNLDPKVAQHPEELVTYGANGSVFQNWYWAQFWQTAAYSRTGPSTCSPCDTCPR